MAQTRTFSRIIASAVVLFMAGNLRGTDETSECFTSIIQPVGWTIPTHGKTVRTGPYKRPGLPDGITFTEFAVPATERFFLPWYYVELGSLVLLSLRFRADSITRLNVDRTPFAWLMGAVGADTGFAADLWWLDRDGDGKFVELQWNPAMRRLPGWVLKRLGREKPSGSEAHGRVGEGEGPRKGRR